MGASAPSTGRLCRFCAFSSSFTDAKVRALRCRHNGAGRAESGPEHGKAVGDPCSGRPFRIVIDASGLDIPALFRHAAAAASRSNQKAAF